MDTIYTILEVASAVTLVGLSAELAVRTRRMDGLRDRNALQAAIIATLQERLAGTRTIGRETPPEVSPATDNGVQATQLPRGPEIASDGSSTVKINGTAELEEFLATTMIPPAQGDRASHRAAVEAGFASEQGYVARWGQRLRAVPKAPPAFDGITQLD